MERNPAAYRTTPPRLENGQLGVTYQRYARVSSDLTKPMVGVLVATGLVCGMLVVMGLTKIAVFVIAILVGIATLLSPLVGLHLVVMSLPMVGLLQLIPDAFTASKGVAIMVAISALPWLVRRPVGDLFRSESLRFYAFIPVWLVLLLPFASGSNDALIDLLKQTEMVGLAFLIATIPQTFQQLRVLCLSATVGSGLLGTYIMVAGAESLARGAGGRLHAGTNENALAYSLAIGLILSGVAWHSAGTKLKITIVALDALAVVATILTASRAAWVSIPFCLMVAPWLVRGMAIKQRILFMVVVAVIGAAGLFLVLGETFGGTSEVVVRRFNRLVEAPEASSGRTDWVWPMHVAYFRENLAFGAGLGLRARAPVSHNDFLGVASEQGLAGILVHILLFAVFFREASRIEGRLLRLVMMMSLLFMITFGQFHNTFLLKSFPLPIGVLACLANLGLCAPARKRLPAPRQQQRHLAQRHFSDV